MIRAIALLLCLAATAAADEKIQGWCQDGGYTVSTPGNPVAASTTTVQRSFKSCTVTVYDAGTVDVATIYSDNSATPKANPFTAASTGQWFFYADSGRFDIRFSGGGISVPFTLGDVNTWDESDLWVNVKSCGAKGDGSTDDSTAINACITQVNAAGGGTVYFPKGDYCLTAAGVTMKSNIRLLGATSNPSYAGDVGFRESVIKTCGAFGETIVIDVIANDTAFENLAIVGDGSASRTQLDATTTGISYGDGNQAYVRHYMKNCSIHYHKYGVRSDLGTYMWWEYNNIGNNWYINVEFTNFGGNDGTYIGNYINTSNWEATNIADPVAELYSGTGLFLGRGCAYQKWIGGKIEYNRQGIVLHQAYNNTFSGIDFDANGSWDIRIRSASLHDDLSSLDNKFIGLNFMGGGYNSNMAGLDAHVLIEGEKDVFYPIQVSANFTGCTFRATEKGGTYSRTILVPKYPQNNVIATRVFGSGVGIPLLRLSCSGCDVENGSVVNGTADISGATVTKLTGPDFIAAWEGKSYWHLYWQPIRIISVNSTTELTFSGSLSVSGTGWSIPTNKILIDAGFSINSDIRFIGTLGASGFLNSLISGP